MFFRQVLYRDLGCASYVIGDAGEAVVVDPRWDIETYLEIARTEKLSITHVIETHDHADHVSGRARLTDLTGAIGHRPAVAGEDRAHAVAAGDEFTLGHLTIRALGTPGHRPEHLSFAVIDTSRGEDPWMVLTGDSLLVGDIARPDLAVEATAGAETMHGALRDLMALGDHVEVWPAHIGGSLCGGAGLSGKTSSTIGFERLHNPLLSLDERAFVEGLVHSIPTRPPNVARVVSLNSVARPGEPAPLKRLNSDELVDVLRAGATVLDGRAPDAFDSCHLAGAINLPLASPGVGTRAGWALGTDDPILISASDPDEARAMASFLHAVGLWNTAGFTLVDRWAWEEQRMPVATSDAWDLEQLAGGLRAEAVDLVDVRDDREWQTGHVAGSHHMPLQNLRVNQPIGLPDSPLTTAVACAAGARAAFAASILRRAGRPDVVRVAGGGVPDLGALGIGLQAGD